MTDRKTHKRRLEAAGYTFVSGWLPATVAVMVDAMIKQHLKDVARISSKSLPRGRSKKVSP